MSMYVNGPVSLELPGQRCTGATNSTAPMGSFPAGPALLSLSATVLAASHVLSRNSRSILRNTIITGACTTVIVVTETWRTRGLVVNPRVFQAAEGRPTIPTTHVNLARVFRAAARRPPRVLTASGGALCAPPLPPRYLAKQTDGVHARRAHPHHIDD